MAQWPVSMSVPAEMYYNMPGTSGMVPSSQSAFPGLQQPTLMPVQAHSRGVPETLPRTMNTSLYSIPQTSATGVKSTVLYQPTNPWRGTATNYNTKAVALPAKPAAVGKKSKNTNTVATTTRKRIKDPNAPKKPPPAFLKWAIEERVEVKRILGSISPSEMSKELGHRWSILNPAIKEVYKQKYKLEKVEYDKLKAGYVPNEKYFAPVKKRRSRKTKKYRDPNAPRKPPPAFLKWSMEERNVIKAEIGPLKPADMGRELGTRWRQLNVQVKLHFQEQYKEDKRQYDLARGKYEPSKQARALVGKIMLKKPPPTFLKWSMYERIEIKKNMGNLSFTEMGKELGRRWANITPEVKAVYKEKYEQEKLEYEAQCQGEENLHNFKKEQQTIIYHE